MTRTATCRCGTARIECDGDPVRVSVCHCLDCQRRTGSPFSAQVRFRIDKVRITGQTRDFTHVGDSGRWGRFSFCPECGTTLFYRIESEPDFIAVPLGVFADPAAFGPPAYSVYEERKFAWVDVTGDATQHYD